MAFLAVPVPAPVLAAPGREIPHGDQKVVLDLTDQVIAARVVDRPGFTLGSAAPGAPVATLEAAHLGRFVSASLLEHKAVLFDEGLQAALAVAEHNGSGKLSGRRQLMRLLLDKLDRAAPSNDAGVDDVIAQLHAAAEVAQLRLPIPDHLAARVRARVVHFRRTDARAFATGVGSFTPELAAAQAMDALLTSRLASPEGATRVARVLMADAGLRRGFQAHASLRRRLSRDALVNDIFDLIRSLEKRQPATLPNLHFLAPWQGLRGVIIDEIQARRLEAGRSLSAAALELLQPSGEAAVAAAAGLIAQRRQALGVLSRPAALEEARRLRWDASYRPLLHGLVATSLQLERPVHIPNTSAGPAPTPAGPGPVSAGVMVQAGSIGVYPEATVEPLPSYYLGRALGYRELRRALDEVLGPRGVAALRRVNPRGELGKRPLDVELREMESLFAGAHLTARRQLGLEGPGKGAPRDLGQGAARDVALFARWSKELGTDEDLGRDGRVMIPLSHDPRSKRTRVLVRLGYSGLPLELAFAVAPKARVVDATGKAVADAKVAFKTIEHTLVYPVTAEALVQNLLSPREMRELCDRLRTSAAILRALK